MKTRITKTLVLMLALSLWSIQAGGQNLVVTASSVYVCPGDTEVVVPITCQNWNGVASVSMTMYFDTNSLTYIGYSNAHPAFSGGMLLINHGSVPGNNIVTAWFGLTPMNIVSGTLYNLRFGYNGGTANFTWGTAAGELLITDLNGTSIPTTMVNGSLLFPSPVSITGIPSNDTIDEGDTTQFSVIANGATAYQWQVSTNGGQSWLNVSNSAVYAGSNTATLFVNGAPLSFNGYNYRCIASETGCFLADTSGPATLVVEEICYPPVAYQVNGGGSYCAGGNGLMVGLSGSEPGVTYTLIRDGVSTGQTLNGTGPALSFGLQTLAGTYTVSAAIPCTTVLMNGSATIAVNPLPVIFDVTGGGEYCLGSPGVPIGLSGSDASSFYTLYIDGAATSTPFPGTGSALNLGTFTGAGTYTVQAVNVFGCNAAMDLNAVVTQNPLPAVFTISGGGYYCQGSNGVSIDLSGSESGVDYELQLNGSLAATLTGTGLPISFQNITATGTYTIDAINASTGCQSVMTGSTMVGTFTLPSVSLSAFPTLCVNSAAATLTQGNPGGGIYQGAGISGGNLFDPSLAGTGSHIVVYTYTDTNGCNNSDTGMIQVLDVPSVFQVTGGGSYCPTGSGPAIGLSGSELNATYTLFLDQATQIASLQGTGSALTFGAQGLSGNYTVQAVYGSQQPTCASDMSGSAIVSLLPLLPPSATTVSVNNISTVSATVSGEAGISCGSPVTQRGFVYALTPSPTLSDNVAIDALSGTGSFTLAISGLNEGETYYVRAYATNSEGTTYGNELTFNTLTTPAFISLGLNQSTDMSVWTAVAGNLASGFTTTINPTLNYYYLDINNATSQSNVPLQAGSYSGFNLTTYPAGFMAYWDAKGVNASAAAGTWQATMWQIVNGNLPIFLIRVNANGTLSLVDGLMHALGMPDELLKVNGDYPLGNYTFTGTVIGQNGVSSLPVSVSFTFNGTAPQFNAIALSQSLDKVVWEDVAGSLAAGFALLLDSSVTFYYLDMKNPQSQTNIPLATGYYGFHVATYPASFFNYWDGRGVNAGAQAGTWQATMWQIINGNLPILYVKALANGSLTLVDGLQYALGQPDDFLRISGDYPEGAYTFSGTVTGINGVVSQQIAIPVTVTRQCIPPVVMSGPVNQSACIGDNVIFDMVVAGSNPFSYQWRFNGTDMQGETGSSLTLANISLSDAGAYSCVITNDCGTAVSPSASLSVNEPPAILTQTGLASVYAGSNASFSISAQNATSYQWQLSTDGGSSWTGIADGLSYAGTTTTTLEVLSSVLTMNGYHFRCIATGICTPADTSQAAALLVTIPVTAIITTAPHLTASVGDTVVVPFMVENFYGVSAVALTLGYDPAVVSFLEFRNIHSSFSGSLFFANNTADEIRVQWLSLIPVNLGTGTLIEVAFIYNGGSTPLIWQLQPAEASQYGNSQALPFPAIWNNGSINPASAITISSHPANTTVCNGAQASFSVIASGATSYLWQVSTNGGQSWTALTGDPNHTGAGTATLGIVAAHSGMNNNLYRCQVSDGIGTAVSGAAFLQVTPWANLSMPVAANPGIEVCTGTAITFSVPAATSLTNPAYTWFLNGNVVGFASTYTLNNPADDDVVSCTILSPEDCAAITSIAQPIELDPLPLITQQPVNTIVYEGEDAVFAVSSPNTGSYQWQVSINGGLSWTNLNNGAAVSGSQTASLSLLGVTLGMNNNLYRCLLTEANCGETLYSASASLNVKQLPVHTFAGSDSACPGDLVVIPITAQNFVNIGSASLRLAFDTAVLDYVGYQNVHPAFSTGTLLIGQNQNQVSVAFFGLSPVTVGNGLLFEVLFTYKGGATNLSWSTNPVFAMYTSFQAQTLEAVFHDGAVYSKPQPVAYDVTGGGNFCFGGNGVSVGLLNSDAGVTYELFLDGVPTGNTLAGSGSSLDFGLQQNAGIYTIQATNDANGCLNMMNGSAVVVVDPLPVVTLNLDPSGVCANASPLALSGGNPAGGTYSGTGMNLGSFDPAIAGIGVHTITYTFIDTNGCQSSASDMIMVNPLPVVIINPTAPVICLGESVLLSVPAGNSYLWSTGDTTANIQLSPVGTSIYSVTSTNSFGCSQSASVTVTVNPLPTVSVDPMSDTICEGSWVTLSASGAISYAWSTGSTSPVITISPASSTSFTVTGTNALGCSDVATSVITVLPAPSLQISPANPIICAGGSINLLASGAQSYSWNTGSTLDNITVSPSATTTYSLTGTDVNGCTSESSITVTVNALPAAFTVGGGGAYCAGTTGPEVTLSGSVSGVNYRLIHDGMPTANLIAGTGLGITFGAQYMAGIYTVLATDTTTLCESTMSGSAVISIDPVPVFSLQPADQLVLIGATATFQASASPAASYQWQVSTDMGASWTNLSNGAAYNGTGTSTLSVGPVPASFDLNWYRLMVSAATCVAYSNPASLSVDPVIPAINASLPSLSACPGDTLVVPVDVTNFNFVGSLNLGLTYDPSILQFAGYQGVMPGLTGLSLVPSQGSIAITWSGVPAFGGNGTLLELLLVYSGGSTSVNWNAGGYFLNGFGDTIPDMFANGNVSQASQAPVVTVNPSPQFIFAAGNTSFSVSASGAGTYQWQVSNNSGTSWTDLMNSVTYSGVNTSTLSITAAPLSYNGLWYRAIAIETTCGLTDISDPAALSVFPSGLTIQTSLSAGTACPGGTISLPLSVNNLYNISSITLNIGYDTNVITYTGYSGLDPQISAGTLMINQTGSQLSIAWFSISPAWIGSGDLMTLNFLYKGGNTALSFNTATPGACLFTDAIGSPVTASYTDGSAAGASQPPVISAQPQGVTVMATMSAGFTVTASNAAAYQWELSIDGGATWNTLSNGSTFSGVTTSSLTVSNTMLSMNGYQFRCVLTEAVCSLTAVSDQALLTVIPFNPNIVTTVPDIVSCPDTITVPVYVQGVDDVYSISLRLGYDTNHMEFIGYQNAHPSLAGGFLTIFPQNGRVGISWFSLNEAQILMGTLVELNFVYHGGNVSLFWDTLVAGNCIYSDMLGAPYDDEYHNGSVSSFGPTIIGHPMDITADDGDTAVFSVNAQLATAYQWQVSVNSGTTWTDLTNSGSYSGVNSPVLHIDPVMLSMDGYLYRVKVSGQCPSEYSDAAELTVTPPLPLVTTSIGTLNACAGNIAIPVRVSNLIGVKSFNLALWFNTDSVMMHFTGHSNVHPALSGGTLSVNAVGDSIIYISFTSASSVTVGTDSLLVLNFTSTGGNTNLRWNTNNPTACQYLDPMGYPFPELYLNGSLRVYELPLAASVPTGPSAICIGGAPSQYVTDTVKYATSYIWTLTPANAGTLMGNTHIASVAWNPMFSGTATLSVQALNACGAGQVSAPLSITINSLPGQSAQPAGPTSLCVNPANSTYTTTGATNAATYTWQLTPAAAGTLSPNGTQVIIDWNNTFTGYAVLTVRGSNSCGNGLMSNGLLIAVHPGITVNLGPDQTVCTGHTVQLNAGNAGSTYLWSNAATSQVINVGSTTAGSFTYSVTVTSNLGCQGSDQVLITFDPCVGIDESVAAEISIFPNPNQGSFEVNVSNWNTDRSKLVLVNLLGEVIWSREYNQVQGTIAQQIDLQDVPAGIYFIRLTSDEASMTRRVIIQH